MIAAWLTYVAIFSNEVIVSTYTLLPIAVSIEAHSRIATQFPFYQIIGNTNQMKNVLHIYSINTVTTKISKYLMLQWSVMKIPTDARNYNYVCEFSMLPCTYR